MYTYFGPKPNPKMTRTRKSKETIIPKMHKFIEKNMVQYFIGAAATSHVQTKEKWIECRKAKWIDLCYYFPNTGCVFGCDKWVTNLKYKIIQRREEKKYRRRRQKKVVVAMVYKNEKQKKANSFNLLVSLLLSVLYWILHSIHVYFELISTSVDPSRSLAVAISFALANLKFLVDYTCTRTFITVSRQKWKSLCLIRLTYSTG